MKSEKASEQYIRSVRVLFTSLLGCTLLKEGQALEGCPKLSNARSSHIPSVGGEGAHARGLRWRGRGGLGLHDAGSRAILDLVGALLGHHLLQREQRQRLGAVQRADVPAQNMSLSHALWKLGECENTTVLRNTDLCTYGGCFENIY